MTAATETAAKAGVYRFGPRETRGVLLGLRAGQLALLLTGAVAVVGGLAVGPLGTLAGVVVLVMMASAALVPVGGRTAEQWLPALAAYLLSRLANGGRTRFRPQRRTPSGVPVALGLPGPLARLVMIEPKADGGRTVGVIRDPSAGTLTAVAAVRARRSRSPMLRTRTVAWPPGARCSGASPATAPRCGDLPGSSAPCLTRATRSNGSGQRREAGAARLLPRRTAL
jgi:hypothetical protein